MTTKQVYGFSAVTRRVWARLSHVTLNTKGSASTETVMALLLVGITGMAGMTTLGSGLGDAISAKGGVAAPTAQTHAGGMVVSSEAGMEGIRGAVSAGEAAASAGKAARAADTASGLERAGSLAENAARAGGHAPWADVAPHPRFAPGQLPESFGTLEGLSADELRSALRDSASTRTPDALFREFMGDSPSRRVTRSEVMNGILEGLWERDVNVTAREFFTTTYGKSVEEVQRFWASDEAKAFVRANVARAHGEAMARATANASARAATQASRAKGGGALDLAQRFGAFTESVSIVAGNGVSRAVSAFKVAFLHGSQSVGARASAASASPRSVAERIAAGFAQDLGFTSPQTFVSRSGEPLRLPAQLDNGGKVRGPQLP